MANINITSDAWTEISITSGTVQNISATADIELSAEQTDNSGVVLKPSELYQWDNKTIYARAVTENTGALRVVNFKKAAGGGGSYVLPVASASTLGGVKVGSNLSIDANGVLSATGGGGVNYNTEEQIVGTWIDGKPLYQKTVQFTLPSSSGVQAYSYLSDIPFSNINILVEITGYVVASSGWRTNYGYVNAQSKVALGIDWNKTSEQIFLHVTSDPPTASQQATLTFQYTKTTD